VPNPTPDQLRIYLTSKKLVADGGTITPVLTTSVSGPTQITSTALSDASDWWNGAIGYFINGTPTVALRGVWFHVKDWDNGTRTLTLAKPLPASVAINDSFIIIRPGLRRSSSEVFGHAIGGALPDMTPINGVTITGLTINKISPLLGEGVLSVFYESATQMLYIKMNSDDYGVGLDVSGDLTDVPVFALDGNAHIRVTISAGALPGTDQTDTWTVTIPDGVYVPDFEGYETRNTNGGLTRYRLQVVRNTNVTDTMIDLVAYTAKPAGDPTVISAGESLGLTDGDFAVDDATDYPTRGFWIKNTTLNDCRYCIYRSGNRLYCLAVDWATLAFDTGTSALAPGDTILGVSSGATAVIDQMVLTGGSWGGGTATGDLLLKNVVGEFTSGELLSVGGSNKASAAANSILGLRGKQAQSWSATDDVEPMADIDIAVEAPSGSSTFTSPSSINTAPDLTFADAGSLDDAISIGSLAPGAMYGVWQREWIIEDGKSRAAISANIYYAWS